MSGEALKIVVKGRVQGVGYRRFAQKAAQDCKISGWARNLYSGEVEIYAQGNQQDLEKYLEKLKRGPLFGRVDEVQAQQVKSEDINGFIILQDGAGG